MLRIGLMGCGRIGRMHARLVARHPACILTSVFDSATDAARAVAVETGARVETSAEELLGHDKVDAVVVASATATHAAYIEASVRAGKPVLCEKPIDLDLGRVLDCRRAVAGSGVLVQIGFNRRFDPGHRALRDGVREGRIGRLLQVLITSRDPEPPSRAYLEAAGGMFRDMTIHDFDLARFVLDGDEPVEVFAVAAPLIDSGLGAEMGDVDCAMVTMTTHAGRQIFITNARQAPYGYDQRLEALGTSGMLQSRNRPIHGMAASTSGATEAGASFQPFFIERYAEAFALQLDAFVKAVSTGSGPEVGFDDGMRALTLAEAAYRSLRSGRAERTDAPAGA